MLVCALGPNDPCVNCGFLDVTTIGERVSGEQYVKQLSQILNEHDFVKENIKELVPYSEKPVKKNKKYELCFTNAESVFAWTGYSDSVKYADKQEDAGRSIKCFILMH